MALPPPCPSMLIQGESHRIIRMWVCWGFVYYSEGERLRWWEKIQRPTGRIIGDRREWIIAVRFSWLVSSADGFIQKQPVFHLVNRFPHIKKKDQTLFFIFVSLCFKGVKGVGPYTKSFYWIHTISTVKFHCDTAFTLSRVVSVTLSF